MSACRLVATSVSSDAGRLTIRAVAASTSSLSERTSGNSRATSAAISSHITIAWRWALLLVTTVRSLLRPRRREAKREAQDALDAGARHHRHVGRDLDRQAAVDAAADARVLALAVLANDHPVQVAAPQRFSGASMPGRIRVGLTFAYWSRPWQIFRRRPQSVT